MKKFILGLIISIFGFGVQAQEQPEQSKAEIRFEKETHDFGKIREGEMPSFEFKFTNIGEEPLVISRVNVSCGCTTPDWTRGPIAPGKTGFVKATYNSTGRPGVFDRSVTITTNAKTPVKVLNIKGEVIPQQPNEPLSPSSQKPSILQKDQN
jgi:Protein of unknown function (DUF1573)